MDRILEWIDRPPIKAQVIAYFVSILVSFALLTLAIFAAIKLAQ